MSWQLAHVASLIRYRVDHPHQNTVAAIYNRSHLYMIWKAYAHVEWTLRHELTDSPYSSTPYVATRVYAVQKRLLEVEVSQVNAFPGPAERVRDSKKS